MNATPIVVLAVAVQLIATVVALRMTGLTGFRLSWVAFAAALFLMVLRRFLSLMPEAWPASSPFYEGVGLAISLLMLAGLVGVAGLFRERREAEVAVARLVEEKERLLKEVHHRVKNNMAMVSGLLELEAAESESEKTKDELNDAGARVRSMALLYDRLYRTERFNAAGLGPYLRSLVEEIAGVYPRAGKIRFAVEADEEEAPASFLSPLGIVMNELITNSVKYAFDGVVDPEIRIAARRADGRLYLEYSDNGRGLREGFSLAASEGFGMQLIASLAKQLGGSMEVGASEGGGARFAFDFPLPDPRPPSSS